MSLSFAFGGNTGLSYEELQRRRAYGEELQKQAQASRPTTAIQGLGSAARSIFGALIEKKFSAQEDKQKQDYSSTFGNIISGATQPGYGGGTAAVPPYVAPDPNSPAVIGHDTMRALGKASSAPTPDEIAAYIADAATTRGIDPSVAVAVARSEGLNANPDEAWQSNFVKNGQREPSYGPFQLYMGGGLGNSFLKQTGLDPRDGSTWKKQVDFSLDHAKSNGWGSWYGAKRSGIGDFQGISGAPQPQNPGVDPSILAAMSDPRASDAQRSALGMLLQQRMQQADPAYQLNLQKSQLELAKLQNPTPSSPEYGLNPVITQDEKGNYHLYQIPKDGSAPKEVQLPYDFTPKQQYLDTGTGYLAAPTVGVSQGDGAIISKDVAGKAAQTAVGEAAGAAQVALPGAADAAKAVADQVESLKNDPYLPNMLGAADSRLPNVSSDAARVQGKMDQLQGGAFLQARQLLKGGGAITDYEGQKAEAAFVRMSSAQKPEDYKDALDEFNFYVQQGIKKLEAQAAMTAQPATVPAPSAPTTGGAAQFKFNPQTGKIEAVQ